MAYSNPSKIEGISPVTSKAAKFGNDQNAGLICKP
jgi:hypothetical protein